MEFFSLEAEEDGFHLQFSDNKIENTEIDVTNFINDDPIEEEDVSFYRQLNPLDINDYPKFNGQVRNPIEAIYSDERIKVISMKLNSLSFLHQKIGIM